MRSTFWQLWLISVKFKVCFIGNLVTPSQSYCPKLILWISGEKWCTYSKVKSTWPWYWHLQHNSCRLRCLCAWSDIQDWCPVFELWLERRASLWGDNTRFQIVDRKSWCLFKLCLWNTFMIICILMSWSGMLSLQWFYIKDIADIRPLDLLSSYSGNQLYVYPRYKLIA